MPLITLTLGRAGTVSAVGSKQSATLFPLLSASDSPQPHSPAEVLLVSFGHPSLQSAVPSESVSVSAVPQPQMPALVLLESVGSHHYSH